MDDLKKRARMRAKLEKAEQAVANAERKVKEANDALTNAKDNYSKALADYTMEIQEMLGESGKISDYMDIVVELCESGVTMVEARDLMGLNKPEIATNTKTEEQEDEDDEK